MPKAEASAPLALLLLLGGWPRPLGCLRTCCGGWGDWGHLGEEGA